jgi:predicted permease
MLVIAHVTGLLSDLRMALRQFVRDPRFSFVLVVTLAAGIAATAVVFNVINNTLLRPLPLAAEARVYRLLDWTRGPDGEAVRRSTRAHNFLAIRERATSFEIVVGIRALDLPFDTGGDPGLAYVALVSPGSFGLLAVQPIAGRLFTPDEEASGVDAGVLVISHAMWQQQLGGANEVLGSRIRLDGRAHTIVGILPPGFRFPYQVDAWMPERIAADSDTSLAAIARLKPGVSREQAQAALNAQYRPIITEVEAPLQKMSESRMAEFRARQMQLEPGHRGQSTVPGETRQSLTILFGVTAIVLLICCANVANLLLGRAAGRSTEMAVRLSIGAGRRHIVAQLLTESVMLALIGGAAGVVVAHWTLTGMAALLPEDAVGALSLQLDAEMLLFAAGLSLGTGLLFGVFPAIQSARPNLITALKAGAGQPSGAKAAARFRVTLVTAQIALSMALLVSAGLFTKSLSNITRVDLGLKTEHLVVFGVAPEFNGYPPQRNHDIISRIEQRLALLPGVSGVTSTWIRLANSSNWGNNFTVQGFTPPTPDADTTAQYNYVGADYLRTLGIPLLSGRELTAADTLGSPKVAVVNEAFIKKFNLGRDAVGKRIKRGAGNGDLDIEIVGVARDSLYSEVKGDAAPVVVFPYRQDENVGSAHFYVRTSGSEEELIASIPRVVREIDATLPVAQLQTMSAQVLENVFLDRFVTSMSAAFASLATLLAALGLYGVLAYTVTQRTREFGLRMALGADAPAVRRLVLRQVGQMTVIGAAIGLASAFALGRTAESLLFRMDARDPMVFAGAAVALVSVALCAGLIPAQRAAKVDPMTALRYE